jgi:hypothetical protein
MINTGKDLRSYLVSLGESIILNFESFVRFFVPHFCKYRLRFLGFGEAACRDVWGVEKKSVLGSDF